MPNGLERLVTMKPYIDLLTLGLVLRIRLTWDCKFEFTV